METVYSQNIKDATNFMADDIIVAFMGPTEAGKSNIVDTLINNQPGRRSAALCLKQIQAVRVYDHPKYANRLILVDTPGLDSTNMSDTDVLHMISSWMKKTYKKSVKLAGVVYVHKITDNCMAGTPHHNLRLFGQLCGDQAIKKVILVTTMWDKLKMWEGAQREHNLRLNYWKVMIEKGALVARFRNTSQTAWKIIDMIVQEPEFSTQVHLLQKELVDLKFHLNETETGITLYSNLQELLIEQQQRTSRLLAEQARAEENDDDPMSKLAADRNHHVAKQFQKTFGERKRLKIPIGRRIVLFFQKNRRKPWFS